MERIELYNDHFQNFKVYGIPHAQLIIADPPYNLGKNAYASNPAWYKDGDNKNGESELAAAHLNRRAYGFEIKKDFFRAAQEKIMPLARGARQTSIFENPDV